MDRKEIYKQFSFIVDNANSSYNRKFELDKNIKLVRGIQMSADKPSLLYYRGSQRIEISGDEVFPEDYESKLMMSGISVAPDQRWVDLGSGVQTGNGEVRILYKDSDNASASFTTYKVIVVLKCELK